MIQVNAVRVLIQTGRKLVSPVPHQSVCQSHPETVNRAAGALLRLYQVSVIQSTRLDSPLGDAPPAGAGSGFWPPCPAKLGLIPVLPIL